MKKKNKITIPDQLSLRNFLAIVLTLVSVFCLFWPPVMKFSDSYKNEILQPVVDQCKAKGFSDADAKEYAEATARTVSFTLVNARGAVHAAVVERELNELYSPGKDENSTSAILLSILVNVLFFGMILTGLAACVFYLLNLTRVVGIVHAAFTLVVLILCGILLLFVRSTKNMFSASYGMFLLPILAVAGCLLYKREKPEPEPEPANDLPKAPETWICTKCGVANPMDEQFCVSCGTSKTARRAFCANCGAPLRSGAPFCTNCGKKQ